MSKFFTTARGRAPIIGKFFTTARGRAPIIERFRRVHIGTGRGCSGDRGAGAAAALPSSPPPEPPTDRSALSRRIFPRSKSSRAPFINLAPNIGYFRAKSACTTHTF
jgi:hypothetical protein